MRERTDEPLAATISGAEQDAGVRARRAAELCNMVVVQPERPRSRFLQLFAKPQAKVTLSFEIGKYLVTQELYELVTGQNPSHFKGRNRPVERVSWDAAVEFCNELSRLLDLAPVYSRKGEVWQADWKATGYRLPTESEWQFACLASAMPVVGGALDECAWYDANSEGKTHEVGQKLPNGFGLHDTLGNVWEWCWDWYAKRPPTGLNPRGPVSGNEHVFRGGGWGSTAPYVQPTYRGHSGTPCRRYHPIGLRLARSLS